MTATLTEAQFLKDVRDHQLQVLHEDGVYRHLRFKRPGTGCMHFDLITYPGHLVYSGDMGCFVFRRLHDMLEFFRTDRRSDDRLYINPSYWSEKLQAVDGSRHKAGATEFSEAKFRRVVNEYRLQWVREREHWGEKRVLSQEHRRELWEAVQDEVLSQLDWHGDGDAAMRAANDFAWRPDHNERRAYSFVDLFEHDFTQYTHRFTWCMYAIAWGVRQYDASKVPA